MIHVMLHILAKDPGEKPAKKGEGEMSGRCPVAQELDNADDQLRWTLSSWRQRRRNRTEALAGYREGQVRHSVQTDLDRELKRGRYIPNGNGF